MSDTLAGRKDEKKPRRRFIIFWWFGGGIVLIAALIAFVIAKQGKTAHVAKEKVENAYVFRIGGKDANGRNADFDLVILTNDFRWVIGSATEVAAAGATIPAEEAANRMFTPQIRASLSKARHLIAVGMASSEGERQAEEARAVARAQTAANWLTTVGTPGTPIWLLTLGQYNKSCHKQEDADTSFERPVMVAGVVSGADGVNLQEALADAISGRDNLPSRDCYSRFDLTKNG